MSNLQIKQLENRLANAKLQRARLQEYASNNFTGLRENNLMSDIRFAENKITEYRTRYNEFRNIVKNTINSKDRENAIRRVQESERSVESWKSRRNEAITNFERYKRNKRDHNERIHQNIQNINSIQRTLNNIRQTK